jgi:hypothetical protein
MYRRALHSTGYRGRPIRSVQVPCKRGVWDMTANAPQFEGITPYLHYDYVPAMIEWTRVFGFKERGRWLDVFAGRVEVWLVRAAEIRCCKRGLRC